MATTDPLSAKGLQQGNTYGQALRDRIAELLRMSPPTMPVAPAAPVPPPNLGTGIAGQGQQTLQNIPYMRHVQEMQAQGLPPLSPQEFAAQQGQ